MSDEFIFGGWLQGGEDREDERPYLPAEYVRLQSPTGDINRVVRDSIVHEMLVSRGWIETTGDEE